MITERKYMNYKELIINHMKENHISYAALGAALGVSRQRAWNMLNNKKSSLNMTTLEKVCKVLRLEIGIK